MATSAAVARKPELKDFSFTWVGQDRGGKTVRGELRASGEAQVSVLLTLSLGSFGSRNSEYIEQVVDATFVAVMDAKAELPLRVSVLKIASPPLVHIRKKSPSTSPADSEFSSPTETAAMQTGGSMATGTSAAPDAQSEHI